MPNPTNETYEEEQQRNIKQGSQGQGQQQDIESPREEEHIDDVDEDDELSTADTDDADLTGGEEQIGDLDDEESIERSADEANESGVRDDNLDEGNNLREAGQRTSDGRRQADDIDIERNDQQLKDDDVEEE